MQSKNILIMIDSLTCGGAEKSLISLLPFLADRGYEITLMLRARGGLFELYVPEEVKIVDFPYKPSRLRQAIYSLAIRLPWNRKRHTAEIYWHYIGRHFPELQQKYDVAIAYQQGFPTFWISEKVKAQKKSCWVNVDLQAAGYSSQFCITSYAKYDNIVVVSDILKNQFIEQRFVRCDKKLVVIRDILNENLIRKLAGDKQRYSDKLNITTVGRLVPQKGYDLAIEAAKILKNKGIEFVWHFVGGGLSEAGAGGAHFI